MTSCGALYGAISNGILFSFVARDVSEGKSVKTKIVWQENKKSKMSNGILASFNHCNNNVGQQKFDEKECEAIINL